MSIQPVMGGSSINYVMAVSRPPSASKWFLAGGVNAANCIAAYAPKGAASLAASYTNLANPGTYNAAPGVAPTFDTATGWTFNGSQWLNTSITPRRSGDSLVVRISDFTGGAYAAGAYDGTSGSCMFELRNTDGRIRYSNGSTALTITRGGLLSGTHVLGVSNRGFYDGTDEGAVPSDTGTQTNPIYIARISGYFGGLFIGKIQAIAIYNTTLTAPQVAAISSAMSLL